MESFYNIRHLDWVQELEKNFNVIREEVLELLNKKVESGFWLKAHPDYVTGTSWKTFELIFFGMKINENAGLCPKTYRLISKIPELITVDFSLLPAKTRILPHKGYSTMILRSHLPLVVPNGDLGIRVEGETKMWKEGELLSFDDSLIHEAWNETNQDRIVMMIDVAKPDGAYSKNEICEYKIANMDDPFLLSMASKEQWKEMYRNKEINLKDLSM